MLMHWLRRYARGLRNQILGRNLRKSLVGPSGHCAVRLLALQVRMCLWLIATGASGPVAGACQHWWVSPWRRWQLACLSSRHRARRSTASCCDRGRTRRAVVSGRSSDPGVGLVSTCDRARGSRWRLCRRWRRESKTRLLDRDPGHARRRVPVARRLGCRRPPCAAASRWMGGELSRSSFPLPVDIRRGTLRSRVTAGGRANAQYAGGHPARLGSPGSPRRAWSEDHLVS